MKWCRTRGRRPGFWPPNTKTDLEETHVDRPHAEEEITDKNKDEDLCARIHIRLYLISKLNECYIMPASPWVLS